MVLGLAAWLGVDYAVTDIPGVVLPQKPDFPAVYHYLAQGKPDRPVLELPAGWTGMQYEYHYYQLAHWRPLVLGGSGTFLPGIMDAMGRFAAGPSEDVLRFLRLTPTATVVLHLERFPAPLAAAWAKAPLDRYGFRRGSVR